MFTSFIIFSVSLLILIAMIIIRASFNHIKHFNFLQEVISLIRRMNRTIKNFFASIGTFIRYFNKRTFSLLFHYLIEKIEKGFERTIRYIKKRLPRKPRV